ncbi:hypothetical protein SLE2022_075710 [Rubroshorea leprosula]
MSDPRSLFYASGNVLFTGFTMRQSSDLSVCGPRTGAPWHAPPWLRGSVQQLMYIFCWPGGQGARCQGQLVLCSDLTRSRY